VITCSDKGSKTDRYLAGRTASAADYILAADSFEEVEHVFED
jgi:hypothetical protein